MKAKLEHRDRRPRQERLPRRLLGLLGLGVTAVSVRNRRQALSCARSWECRRRHARRRVRSEVGGRRAFSLYRKIAIAK
jgi:hypothetical protein